MKTFSKKLPIIIDLQPEPDEVIIRLPSWMMYLFVMLYLVTFLGLSILGYAFYKDITLYQEKLQAQRTIQHDTVQINNLQTKLAEFKGTQREYENYKMRQKLLTRPAPLLEWIPSLVSKTERTHTITMEQIGVNVNLRVTLEKPIVEGLGNITNGPAEYQIMAAGEESPKYGELPQGQKPNMNNEFTTITVQIKKQP